MAKPRLLIVDDDRTARVMLQRLLSREGFEVLECGDGQAALEIIDSTRISLIVSDYEMPGMTGAELCERLRLRDDPELQNLPVILLTAYGGEQHEVESLESGANDFVAKPVNVAVLRARIDTHLRLHAFRRELEVWRQNHETDLEAARLLQRAIIPARQPQISGWRSAAYYQPVIQVGGDMYDWLRLPDGSWLFWIADATGHGVSAALLTSLTKLMFRHSAGEFETASEVLGAVNREFFSVFRGKSFMTAACVVVKPGAGGEICFAGAGHPPLLVTRLGGGTSQSFRSQTPPLGILEEQSFEETEVQLEPGEFALLYTDGLYAAPVGEASERSPVDIQRVLPKDAAAPEEFIRQTLAAMAVGESLSDDLALLALQRVAP